MGPFSLEPFTHFSWVVVLLGVLNVIIVVAIACTIGNNRRPTTAVAWLLAITLIPYLGLMLFLVFGTNRLPKVRRKRQSQFDHIIREVMDELETAGDYAPVSGRFRRVSKLARSLTAIPHLPGNRIQIHTDYNETIEAMAAEIDTATDYVHVLFYAAGYDAVTQPFFDALERAVARGVTVRFLYDQWGSLTRSGYRQMKRRLTEAGVKWHRLYSIWPTENGWQRFDLRNHRKLVVVDGDVAWIGSENLIARDYHKKPNRHGQKLLWKDLMVRLDGPIALGVDAIFRSDWFVETDVIPTDGPVVDIATFEPAPSLPGEHDYDCQLVPSGPGYEHENNLRIFNQLLYQARKRVVICSPYLVPDDSILYAITTATQRGVDIELHVSEQGDQFFTHHAQQSYYEQLLRAGVRIWRYKKPYILHSKHMTVDGEVTMLGSSNMDMRSFTLNAEMMLLVYGRPFTEQMHAVEQSYRDNATELTLVEWMSRPRWQFWLDDVCRLTSVVQ